METQLDNAQVMGTIQRQEIPIWCFVWKVVLNKNSCFAK